VASIADNNRQSTKSGRCEGMMIQLAIDAHHTMVRVISGRNFLFLYSPRYAFLVFVKLRQSRPIYQWCISMPVMRDVLYICIFYLISLIKSLNMMNTPYYSVNDIITIFQICKCEVRPALSVLVTIRSGFFSSQAKHLCLVMNHLI